MKKAEEILRAYEVENADRFMDHQDYYERVILPAMEEYASQFKLKIPTDKTIEKQANLKFVFGLHKGLWESGAMWMRDKIFKHIRKIK
jgi:hypothetical protein